MSDKKSELEILEGLVKDGFPLTLDQRMRLMALKQGGVAAAIVTATGQRAYMRKVEEHLDKKGVLN